ncbi:sugar lactone lactonase YvrE [Motilibacter rhizosphaerae]|uniref:Sugar lactone lactonase YvrE n=1 Tax=Motilibacter rhizosphaerae TaxID=598652 RepID=A0A4Q7NR92_9ACTN|nr:SMP-30/gluconolactonase/LRE family protein [Motilibacter rhizosphaerae]RZS87556.1 sugar lactone lactonase YvrE [Motilibacter rhizosphaerae]
MRTFVADPVTELVAEHAEGPRWDAGRGELAWVDIPAGRVHRAVPREGRLELLPGLQLDVPVGAANPVTGHDGWILAAGTGFVHARLAEDGTQQLEQLARPDAGREDDVRMNEAVCDPVGRLLAGTMAYDQRPGGGRLLQVDLDGSVRTLVADATVANGLAWSSDGATVYWADSGPGRLTAHSYDLETGEFGPGRLVEQRSRDQGVSDGIAIDDEDCLWVARFGGGAVDRISPEGEILTVVSLPVEQVTAVAFAGTTLYITTSREGLDASTVAGQPHAGKVFAVDAAVSGPPARAFKAQLPRD